MCELLWPAVQCTRRIVILLKLNSDDGTISSNCATNNLAQSRIVLPLLLQIIQRNVVKLDKTTDTAKDKKKCDEKEMLLDRFITKRPGTNKEQRQAISWRHFRVSERISLHVSLFAFNSFLSILFSLVNVSRIIAREWLERFEQSSQCCSACTRVVSVKMTFEQTRHLNRLVLALLQKNVTQQV